MSMLPSGFVTRQMGDKLYVLVGLKDQAAPPTNEPGEPAWLRFDAAGVTPIYEGVPDGKRLALGVNLPL